MGLGVDTSMTKPTYTVSKFETFLRCEKEFELKYVWSIKALPLSPLSSSLSLPLEGGGIKGEGETRKNHLSPLIFGTLIHEIMQFLTWPNFENEDTVILQALQNQQITDPHFFEEIKKLLSRIKTNKTWFTLMQASQKQNREVPFFWDAGNFYLKGTIDCLSFDGTTWTIIDYKTDRVKTEEESIERAETYYGQMASYALAASHLLKVAQLETKLLFTSGPYVVNETWDRKKMQEAKNIFEKTHHEICEKNVTSHYQFPENKKRCLHCSYYDKNYCGVKNL